MTAALRAFVRERAGRRCEYCGLYEDDADFLSFHVAVPDKGSGVVFVPRERLSSP
jgi:hypothetical protein